MSKTFQYREPTNPEEIALFYRRLEHYLHPESRQSGDWNNTKTIAILGDSYLIEKRVIADMGKTPSRHIPMLPHATEGRYPEYGDFYRSARIENLSKGGGTMQMMLEDKSAMKKWVEEVPALTIMHLGGCDISNGDISEIKPKVDYKNKSRIFYENLVESSLRKN